MMVSNTRKHMLDKLRQSIREIDGERLRLCDAGEQARFSFGMPAIDQLLAGGLAVSDMHEVRYSLARDAGSAIAFLCGLMARQEAFATRPVVWICDVETRLDGGQLYPDGLLQFGLRPENFLFIYPVSYSDALWAAGEAATAGGFSGIIFHLRGHPKSFDLSASRQLLLRVQNTGTPLFVLRQSDEEEASSVSTRWHVAPARSLPDPFYEPGIGQMRLALALERNRNGRTGDWSVAWNRETRSFEDASPTHSRRPVSPFADRPHRPQPHGQVMALERKADWNLEHAS